MVLLVYCSKFLPRVAPLAPASLHLRSSSSFVTRLAVFRPPSKPASGANNNDARKSLGSFRSVSSGSPLRGETKTKSSGSTSSSRSELGSAKQAKKFSPTKSPKFSNNCRDVEGLVGREQDGNAGQGVRINKCLPTLSRRGADEAVLAGRVSVNGKVVTSAGHKVNWGDKVLLDNKLQQWEGMARAKFATPSEDVDERDFLYVKYWKPAGVTCTSDRSDPTNIISAGKFSLFPQRVFTVGRLDKDSSGLILLTSDGRVNKAFLHRSQVKSKIYEVTVDQPISNSQLQQLRSGIVITTPVQRDTPGPRFMTAKTLPCEVVRITDTKNTVQMTLIEGRNRQIRRMMQALGLNVVSLHRTSFAGITLKGLKPGDWQELSKIEMKVVSKALEVSSTSPGDRLSEDSTLQGRERARHVIDDDEE